MINLFEINEKELFFFYTYPGFFYMNFREKWKSNVFCKFSIYFVDNTHVENDWLKKKKDKYT